MAEPELLFENSDFESGNLKNWTAEGKAFAMQPTKGDNVKVRGRTEGSKHQGNFWIGTYEAYNGTKGKAGETQGDKQIGRLTSKEFEIKKDFINFTIGAGDHEETSVRIIVDGTTYYLASGRSTESMSQVSADVKQFRGKKAKIVILDNVSGGWGHINADNFTASEKPLVAAVKPKKVKKAKLGKPKKTKKRGKPLSGPAQKREFVCETKYLLLPIANGNAKPIVSLDVDGKNVRWVTAELASSEDKITLTYCKGIDPGAKGVASQINFFYIHF